MIMEGSVILCVTKLTRKTKSVIATADAVKVKKRVMRRNATRIVTETVIERGRGIVSESGIESLNVKVKGSDTIGEIRRMTTTTGHETTIIITITTITGRSESESESESESWKRRVREMAFLGDL